MKCMTRSLDIMPKTTKQHLIICSDKSNVCNSARRFSLLKLTTDRHEASRGLSATAELLVVFVFFSLCRETWNCMVTVGISLCMKQCFM